MKNNDYINKVLELHLFYDRIMMEHAIFLYTSFTEKDVELKNIAFSFYNSFVTTLDEIINLSSGNISNEYLNSNIAFTKYTKIVEEKTNKLTGLKLNTDLTEKEININNINRNNIFLINKLSNINKRTIPIINNFINYKEQILDRVLKCNLFTKNYPLFIMHIINEARMYQRLLTRIESNQNNYNSLKEQELFWNDIMKEHALFIRGELDPTEERLIYEANNYSKIFENILEKYSNNYNELYNNSLIELSKFKIFNLKLLDDITNCRLKSIMLPILLDHTYRELNYFNKILNDNNIEYL